MIDIDIIPAEATPSFMDFGSYQKPFTGAKVLRLDRPGGKFGAQILLPPMHPKDARAVVAKVMRGKQEGLRIAYPLMNVSQGNPGSPLVNGAGQSGTTLNIDGLTPHYAAREGFWLSIVQSGQHYLHSVATSGAANGSGVLALSIFPALRVAFSDNAVVHLAKPMIEGFVVGDVQEWQLSSEGTVSIGFQLEEAE
jgi:hypothetical protein